MRAAAAEFKNVAIASHYPDWAQDNINLRAQFLNDVLASAIEYEPYMGNFVLYIVLCYVMLF